MPCTRARSSEIPGNRHAIRFRVLAFSHTYETHMRQDFLPVTGSGFFGTMSFGVAKGDDDVVFHPFARKSEVTLCTSADPSPVKERADRAKGVASGASQWCARWDGHQHHTSRRESASTSWFCCLIFVNLRMFTFSAHHVYLGSYTCHKGFS